MKAITALAGAVALAAAFTAPAMASYVRLGNADVGFRADTDTAYSRFGGRLESLRLTASRSDIFCRSVVVQYENGERQNVFNGRLDERRPIDVDLRGRARKVDSIRFNCRSDEYRGGRIYVDGEVGRYRDEWRRDRDWDRLWAGLFGMGPGGMGSDRGRDGWDGDRRGSDRDGRDGWGGDRRGSDRDGRDSWGGDRRGPDRGWNDREWISLGTQSFEGRNDKENTFAGWAGRRIERIALRPLDNDAQCMSIVATLDGGRKIKLADGRMLERGRVTIYDLPGHDRDMSKLYLRCRAVNGYRVTIEILTRR